jgi:hypothetical protein
MVNLWWIRGETVVIGVVGVASDGDLVWAITG